MPAPDSTPLAQRLVEAALNAADTAEAEAGKGRPTRAVLRYMSEAAVVAVLRELAAAEKTFGVGTLEDLADSIAAENLEQP